MDKNSYTKRANFVNQKIKHGIQDSSGYRKKN
jgi:hypothetical protein